mgnify:CR=1 FL=1
MKELLSRVSVPGRIFDLLWTDDEFYREVSSSKKISSSGKFPRCDQWCDSEGFYMAFALAGYSAEDLSVDVEGNVLSISGTGPGGSGSDSNSFTSQSQGDERKASDDYPPKMANPAVQQGMIVRGIARRKFRTNYFVHPNFNLSASEASIKNGLLEIFVPRGTVSGPIAISVKEK